MRCGFSLQSGLREQQRFRVVQKILPLYHAIQPAKAASRLGLPHALQDASRSRQRRPTRHPLQPLQTALYALRCTNKAKLTLLNSMRLRPFKHALNACQRPGKNTRFSPDCPLNNPTSSLPNRFMVFIVY